MRTDEELKKAYKIFIDENDLINLIWLEYVPEPEENIRVSKLVEQDLLDIFNKNPQKEFRVLGDFSAIKNKVYFSLKARDSFIKVLSHKQVIKGAWVGGGVFLKTIANLLFAIIKKGKKMKCFFNREKAMEWLLK